MELLEGHVHSTPSLWSQSRGSSMTQLWSRGVTGSDAWCKCSTSQISRQDPRVKCQNKCMRWRLWQSIHNSTTISNQSGTISLILILQTVSTLPTQLWQANKLCRKVKGSIWWAAAIKTHLRLQGWTRLRAYGTWAVACITARFSSSRPTPVISSTDQQPSTTTACDISKVRQTPSRWEGIVRR